MSEHEIDRRLRSWARSSTTNETPMELRERVREISTTDRPTDERHRPRLIQRNGGTRSMFSATKLFALAASIALIGVMIVSRPFSAPAPEVPAATTTDPGGISKYSGSMRPFDQQDEGTIEVFDWGSRIEGERWSARMEMDDPRVSGTSACLGNAFVTDSGAGWLRATSCRLFNEGGTWHVTSHGYLAPRSGGIHYQQRLVGEAGYDGLFAVQRCDMDARTALFDCEGAVFEGGFPDAPAEAPAELPDA